MICYYYDAGMDDVPVAGGFHTHEGNHTRHGEERHDSHRMHWKVRRDIGILEAADAKALFRMDDDDERDGVDDKPFGM